MYVQNNLLSIIYAIIIIDRKKFSDKIKWFQKEYSDFFFLL